MRWPQTFFRACRPACHPGPARPPKFTCPPPPSWETQIGAPQRAGCCRGGWEGKSPICWRRRWLRKCKTEKWPQSCCWPPQRTLCVASGLPHRFLALIRAYRRQPGGPPIERLPTVQLLIAELLVLIGEFHEALGEAQRAVQILEAGDLQGRVDNVNLARALTFVGTCQYEHGNNLEALPWFERAVAEIEKGDGIRDRQPPGLGEMPMQRGLVSVADGKVCGGASLVRESGRGRREGGRKWSSSPRHSCGQPSPLG